MVDDVFHIHITVACNRMQVSKKRRKTEEKRQTTEVERRNPFPSLPLTSHPCIHPPCEETADSIRNSGHHIKQQFPVIPHYTKIIPLLELCRYQHLVRAPGGWGVKMLSVTWWRRAGCIRWSRSVCKERCENYRYWLFLWWWLAVMPSS